jgi:hypothetical protein
MTVAARFLVQVSANPQERPVLSVRRRSFFRRGYYVVATWRDGSQVELARFAWKECAAYWLQVEGDRWLDHCCRPLDLEKALRLCR